MVAIFKKFRARYTHKWTSAIEGMEEYAIKEWSQALSGFTADEIKRGLDAWAGDWPPTLIEFKNACKGKTGKNEFGLDYIPECYRTKTFEKSRLLSSDDRDKKRKSVISGISNMKKGLSESRDLTKEERDAMYEALRMSAKKVN